MAVRRRTPRWAGGAERQGGEVGVPPAGGRSNCTFGTRLVQSVTQMILFNYTCSPKDNEDRCWVELASYVREILQGLFVCEHLSVL